MYVSGHTVVIFQKGQTRSGMNEKVRRHNNHSSISPASDCLCIYLYPSIKSKICTFCMPPLIINVTITAF